MNARPNEEDAARLDAVRRLAQRTPRLGLLVLFGSRARGDAHEGSDWDFGFLGAIDDTGLRVAITQAVATDAVDLVDLRRASALLRYRAARDGVALFESGPDAFDDFRVQAASFWCDVAPIVSAAYDTVLSGLDP